MVDMGEGQPTHGVDSSPPEFPDANIVAVEAIAGVLKNGFGPISRDTLVVTQLETQNDDGTPGVPGTDEFVVTSDGATILEELPLEHPIAPVVHRIVGPERPGDTDIEGEDIPDGVTSTVVLASALLHEAQSLLDDGLHPSTLVAGYERALGIAVETLTEMAQPLDEFPDPTTKATNVARTAMTGNDVGGAADKWARLTVEAADKIGFPTEETFVVRQFSKGQIEDSNLIRGAVLDRNKRAHRAMPSRKEDASVLLLDGQDSYGLQLEEPEADINLQLDSATDGRTFRARERAERRDVVSHLRSLGVDVVVVRSGIDSEYQHLLADNNIVGIRGVTRLDFRQVGLATGAVPVLKPREATRKDLGRAGVVEERRVEPRRHRRKTRRIMVFEDCSDPASVVMTLRGVSGQLQDQATRQVRKATVAVAIAQGNGHHDPGVVPGGGASEIRAARRVADQARKLSDRTQLAVEGFADALESVVATLVRNGGRDPISTLAALRKAHADGRERTGIVFPDSEIRDTVEAGVLDPASVKRNQLVCATEVAELLLTIDDALDATFTEASTGPTDALYEEPARQQQRHREREGAD